MSVPQGEFRLGWRIIAASFLGIGISISSLYFYSLGIFIKPMAAEFGWSRGAASLGALVGTLCTALMALPMGRIIDRIGSVPVAIGSLLLLALGFASLGWLTTGMASFLVLTAILSLLTAGASPLSFTRLVVAAFERNRGIALGLILSGNALGAILVPILLTPYIATHGWRAGYFTLAGVILVLLPLLWLLLGKADEGRAVAAPTIPLSELFADRAFRLLALVFFLAAIAVLGTVVQFVPMLTDWGMSPAQAGSITAMIGFAAIAGRLLAGAMLDRLPPHLVTMGLFGAAAIGLLTLGLGGLPLALPGALITGVAIGAEVDLCAFLVGRYFPKAVYGQTYGAIYGVFLVGGAVGPALSGYLHDASGDYRLSLLVAATLLGIAALTAFGFRQLPRVGL